MGQEALYLKWRPRTFDEVVGQSHVTRTLKNACRSGRVSHAYLFAGPRGTGKTSLARILAKALNCQEERERRPCNECRMCLAINQGRFLDLIEIDGASNRGIDEIRDLREKVNFRPNEGGYKVYIIDEVHMLTREAFNALLKTLEEPPEYVVFVFATTEVWRVPPTIRSRCQRFDFRPIKLDLIESRLRQVCEEEGIGRDDAALTVIARQATGSLRDAISMLDQMASIGEGMVTADLVRSVLGTAPDEAAERLLGSLFDDDLASALEMVSELAAEGFDMRQFAQDVLEISRAMLLLRLGVRPEAELPSDTLIRLRDAVQETGVDALLRLTRALGEAVSQVRQGHLPQLPLELALVQAHASLAERPSAATVRETAVPFPARSEAAPTRPVGERPRRTMQPTGPDQPPLTVERLRKLWPKVTAKVYRRDRTLEALLRSTEPLKLEGDVVTVGFAYPFHCDCFAGGEEREVLVEALRETVRVDLDFERAVIVPGKEEQESSAAPAEGPEEVSLEQDPLYRTAMEMGGRVRVVDSGGESGE